MGRPDEVAPYFNALFYGHFGVGKTVLAASACEVEDMSPVLVLDVEGGTMPLRKFHPEVEVIRIKSFQDFVKLHGAIRANPEAYKTIVFDSLTEIQKLGMYEVMGRAIRKAEENGEERDPDLPGIGEWGKNIEQTRKVIRAFRDLPCNVIFTALVNVEKSNKGRNVHKPSLPGKMAGEVGGFLDIVGYMYRADRSEEEGGGTERRLLTMATEEYLAKDRSDNLPPVLVNPTMAEIHRYIHTSHN